jgi:DNA-binding NarL/FixJ family response regulator
MTDLRLLIIAPDPLARAGLATLLANHPGYEVVGQIGLGESLPAEIDAYRPDVIVWDLGWEPEEGLELLGEVAPDPAEGEPHIDSSPSLMGGPHIEGGPRIVGLLPDGEHASVVWSSGARGLLLRDVTAVRLLAATTAVFNGLATVEPEFLDILQPAVSLEEPALVEDLTPREVEVLELLAEGLANKTIAQQLEISDHTVKFHVNAIMSKLDAQSRTEAVVRATRLGLIML